MGFYSDYVSFFFTNNMGYQYLLVIGFKGGIMHAFLHELNFQ